MNIVLVLAAASVAAAPAAAFAETHGRPAVERRAESHPAYGNRAFESHALVRPALVGGGRAAAFDARRGALIDNRAGYADRPYAYTGQYGRYRDRFGIGFVSAGPAYAGGYYGDYDNGYPDAGYYNAGVSDTGYADTGYYNTGGYDGGQGYAYDEGASPYIAGSYAAALEQGYGGGGQPYQQAYPSGSVYESVTTSYSASGFPAPGATCGQWAWDQSASRYSWVPGPC